MITKIQTPSAIHAYRQYPLEGTGVQTDPFDWYTKATVVDTVSTVTVVEAGDYDSIEKYYNAKLTASQLYTFSISGVDDMSTTVTIYYEGTQVAQSVFGDMEWTWGLSYTPDTTGTYLIKISTYFYGSTGTLSVTPVPTEITPWIEKASGVFESTGFDTVDIPTVGTATRMNSLKTAHMLVGYRVYSCGNNEYGQLGIGPYNPGLPAYNSFVSVDTKVDWLKASCGSYHTVLLSSYGELFGCGYNYDGQLGFGNTQAESGVLTRIGTASNWMEVSCGLGHTLAINSDGEVWGCGQNASGLLGLGDNNKRSVFVQISSESKSKWKSVSCGNYHNVLINEDGELWGCGQNHLGQFGLGEYDELRVLTRVGTASNWKSVSCGGSHTMVINTSGELWGCGLNNKGQLGLGDTTKRTELTRIGAASNWKSVSCSTSDYGATVALNMDGELWGCGQMMFLGAGSGPDRNTLEKIGEATNWASVNCGGVQVFALTTTNELWAWGENNTYGLLGLGNNKTTLVPTRVGTETNWKTVIGGVRHSIALQYVI